MKVSLDKRVECQKCGAHVLGTLCVANAWLVIHEKYACPERSKPAFEPDTWTVHPVTRGEINPESPLTGSNFVGVRYR